MAAARASNARNVSAAMNAVPGLEAFARLGFAARGLLYLLIAYLAIGLGRNAGSADVLRSLAGDGESRLILGLLALGLLAYGAWRCLEAVLDLEGAGRGGKGAVVRAGHGLSGATHLALGLLASGLALGVVGAGGGGDSAPKATGWVMGLPAGAALVRLLAMGFILGGLAEGWSAYRLKFLEQLDGRAAGEAWVKWIGRLGYVARGLVFVMIGLQLWRAAGAYDPGQAGGMGEALGAFPGWARALVAIGLGLFGGFSLVQAVYRRITDPHVLERLELSARYARRRGR
jgi:hypothetical protein